MSWIIRDLWSTLEAGRDEYASLLETNKVRAFEAISRIANEVGQRYGIFLQVNFPPGQGGLRLTGLGHRDLSILVHPGRYTFGPITETEVERIFEELEPRSLEPLRPGQEGFKVQLSDGRIDCLPSGVHLWCEIKPQTLEVLDVLFTNIYGLRRTIIG